MRSAERRGDRRLEQMKKLASLFLICTITLTGCNAAGEAQKEFEADGAYFSYPAENVTAFDISSDGTLYTAEGEKESIICSYDLSGARSEIADIGENTEALACFDNNLCYAIPTDNGTELLCMDIKTGQSERLCEIEGLYNVNNLEITNGSAYILGRDASRINVKGTYFDEFGMYEYTGERMYKVSLGNGEITAGSVEFPQAFSALDGDVLVYAADEDGFYFTDFDNEKKSYNDLGSITAMELYDKDKFIFSSDKIIFKLNSASADSSDGIAEITENVIVSKGNDVRFEGGFGFVRNLYGHETEDGVIERFKTSDYIKPNNKIRFISAEYSFDEPFGCGYVIEQRELDSESFALTVLSQDSGYDMCIINSAQDYSANIRSKGSFYPLNDVEGVAEYLENCFPYVKDTAYTEDGDIWMLPVLLNAGSVYYSSENCSAAGVSITDDMLYEDFINQCKKASESDFSDGYSAHCYQLTQNMLLNYLSANTSFNTELFRSFAEFSKENANISSFPSYMPISCNAENELFSGKGAGGFLFGYCFGSSRQLDFAELDFLRARPIPQLEGISKNAVTCAFITVNPSSSNLEAALDYIGSLAKHLSTQKNSLILSDKSLYSDTDYMRDLYGIYENGQICFNVSSEIIFDDYIEYCSGRLDLDSLILEADRKYAAYLNE